MDVQFLSSVGVLSAVRIGAKRAASQRELRRSLSYAPPAAKASSIAPMNTAPARARLILCGLLLVILALVWVGRDRGYEERKPVGDGDAQTTMNPRLSGTDQAGAAPHASSAPASRQTSPMQGPLLDRVPLLRQRARTGNARAACQLALEFSTCRAASKRWDMSRTMEYAAATSEAARLDVRVIDAIADVREDADRVESDCAGLEIEGDSDVVALLQAAAPNGNARQKVIAALTQPDGSLLRLPRGPEHTLPMDPWVSAMASQFYADNALRYLHEGFRARDPLALEGLILVHAPDVLVPTASTDAAFRLPDPRRFVALALLAEEVYGADMLGSQVRQLLQRTLEALSAKERGRAESDAKRWAQTWRASTVSALPEEGIDAVSIDAVCR